MQQNEPGETAISASIAGNGARMPMPTKANRSKRIVISMSPHTAGCVEKAQELLEKDGYEVTVIHTGWADAEGVMEAIGIETVGGVLDVTLTGLADELLGGAQTLGLALLDAAAAAGVPLLLAPGGLDMVTFTSREAIPPQWGGASSMRPPRPYPDAYRHRRQRPFRPPAG